MSSVMKQLGKARRWTRENGPMQWADTAWKRHQFIHARQAHLFQGVYKSFADAVAHAPTTAPTSYDNTASAKLYLNRLQMDDYDHPALFWLGDAIHRVSGRPEVARH